MKNYFLCVLLLIPILAIAQNKVVTGVVKDVITKEPIKGISITISGVNERTMTNEVGEFRVLIPVGYTNLNFYHLGYDEQDYQINKNGKVEILMTPKAYQFQEVAISSESGKDSLVKSVNNSRKRLEKSFLLNTYYREFTKVNDEYTAFADGMLDYYTHKKTVGNKKNLRKINVSDLYVKQNRVVRLSDSNSAGNNWKLGLSFFDFQDVKKMVLEAYDFDIVNKIVTYAEEYNFKVINKKDKAGNRIKVINIAPKENVKSDLMYIGSVTYDEKSGLILDVDLKFSPEHKKYAMVQSFWLGYKINLKMDENSRRAIFKIDGTNYVMLYDERKATTYIKVDQKFEGNIERIYHITTLDCKEGEFNLSGQDKYRQLSLVLTENRYKEEFWKNRNVMSLSEKEEEIVKILNQKNGSGNTESAALPVTTSK